MEFTELQNQFANVLLTAIGARDAYTEKHSSRLSLLAREICNRLNLSPAETKKLEEAEELRDEESISI